jgi:hypothetical protein
LGNQVLFLRYIWSGSNSIQGRRTAAQDLQTKLGEVLEAFPNARHYIISHSHGGNIVFNALTASIAKRINGIICLATPILVARKRSFSEYSVSVAGTPVPIFFFAISGATYLGSTYILSKFGYYFSGDSLINAVIGFFTLGFANYAQSWSLNLLDENQDVYIESEKVLFLRIPGDEASAILSAAHAVSWMLSNLFIVLPSLLKNLSKALQLFIIQFDPAKSMNPTNKKGRFRFLFSYALSFLICIFLFVASSAYNIEYPF